jgi:hypothetical protein
MNRTDTKTACLTALLYYKDIWQKDVDTSHLWQKSNQVISYFNFAAECTRVFGTDDNWYQLVNEQPSAFLKDFEAYVKTAIGDKTLWTDDFGWAGLACVSVAKWVKDNQPNANPPWTTYMDYAAQCWLELYHVSTTRPAVYDTSPVPGKSQIKPVPAGTSNRPLEPEDLDEANYMKNTVSNALYFNLSMALYDFLGQVSYVPKFDDFSRLGCLQGAYNQYIYFRLWFATPRNIPAGIPENYFHTLIDSQGTVYGAMVEERPVAYDGVGVPPNKGYDPRSTLVAW